MGVPRLRGPKHLALVDANIRFGVKGIIQDRNPELPPEIVDVHVTAIKIQADVAMAKMKTEKKEAQLFYALGIPPTVPDRDKALRWAIECILIGDRDL